MDEADPRVGLPDVFTYAQARKFGLTDRDLHALRSRGEVERLRRGLYMRPDAAGDPDLLEIAASAPDATLCLTTALARHGLTDEVPAALDVALPRTRRHPAVSAPVIWHRFDPRTFDIGREPLVVGELALGLYSAERSICDAFRLRAIVGPEQPIEALKRWLRARGSQPSSLLQTAAKVDPRVMKPIRGALEILL